MSMQTKKSRRWMQRHVSDPYVKLAKQQGFRSRSAFKLLELQEKYSLIRSGMGVIDLGAAPGGWSQVVVQQLKGSGWVVALDILKMEVISGVDFVVGDFTDNLVLQQLVGKTKGRQVDLVISDMAPNISGIEVADQYRAMALAELALELTYSLASSGSAFLVKVFQGLGFDQYLAMVRQGFARVNIRKPKASRAESKEVYILARGLKESCAAKA